MTLALMKTYQFVPRLGHVIEALADRRPQLGERIGWSYPELDNMVI